MDTQNLDTVVTKEVTFKNYKFVHDYPELYDFKNKSLTPNMKKINFVVTHGNCPDGFMSATIAQMWFKKNDIDLDTVTFYNAYYGSDFSKLPDMMKDKYVIICDFSFPKYLFDKMVTATNGNILILDHHVSAQKSLRDVEPQYLIFDMKHSGAFITWTYFFGFKNIPKAVLYVEDHDIWTKNLPQTDEFTAYMYSREFKFDVYERFFDDNFLIEEAFPIGTGMVMQNKANIASLNKSCIPQFIQTSDGRYYFVACINSAGILRSELGNFVLTTHKNANFSMVYSHNQYVNSTSISYRSLDHLSDSTEIAKFNGGGGHRNASGASIPFKVDTPPGKIIDKYRAYFMLNELYETSYGNNLTKKTNFLVLNASTTKKHLAKYLMQERYINDDGLIKNEPRISKNLPGYQEGMFCMRNKWENETYDCVYSGAYIWHYDGHNEKYKITVYVLPNTFDNEKITNFSSHSDIDNDNDNDIKIIDYKNGMYEIETSKHISPEQIISSLLR